MKTYKVHDQTVVLTLSKQDALTLQRGLVDGYFPRNIAWQRICEKLQDALCEVDPAKGPVKNEERPL